MADDYIGYAEMIDAAMRGVVRETLHRVAAQGLRGDHHCYISFKTTFPGVSMAPSLMERYPEEMTIVLQHQFWNLTVEDEWFSVMLSFNGKREKITVPFDALTAFADPSIKFGLQFQHKDMPDTGQASLDDLLDNASDDDAKENKTTGAKVIALDKFRNKNND